MFYSPIIRFKPVIQYKHKLEKIFQEAAKTEKNKENKSKTKLYDELLDKVNGGEWGFIPLPHCSNCSYVGDRYPVGTVCPQCQKGVLC